MENLEKSAILSWISFFNIEKRVKIYEKKIDGNDLFSWRIQELQSHHRMFKNSQSEVENFISESREKEWSILVFITLSELKFHGGEFEKKRKLYTTWVFSEVGTFLGSGVTQISFLAPKMDQNIKTGSFVCTDPSQKIFITMFSPIKMHVNQYQGDQTSIFLFSISPNIEISTVISDFCRKRENK